MHRADVVVGYTPYVESLADVIDTARQDVVSTGMMQEVSRCRSALEIAAEGKNVALVSSGDAGVYGMAGLAIELAHAENYDVEIEVVAGVSAANAAGCALGAPLMLDYAVVSLSDLLVPWDKIRTRLEALAQADMVTVLYNPKSKKRITQIVEAVEIYSQILPGDTPVGVVTAAGCADEKVVITDLANVLDCEITMRSVVVIGNSSSVVVEGKMITPRGYKI